MKKILLILIMLFAFHPASVSAETGPGQAVLSETAVWPNKAYWVGQQATIYPAKLYASASYLLLFRQPGQDMSGVDQLFLGRKLIGQTYTVKGLYKLTKKGAVPQHYWQLTASGGAVVWVRDNPDGQLSALPFALSSEIVAENKTIAELGALVGTTVWLNRNLIPASELTAAGGVGHLAPLTVTAFKSAGPFSDAYSLAFRQEDGTPVVWTMAPTGARAAYSNGQFFAHVQKSFFRQDPRTLFPHWGESVWPLIRAREIRVGWDREMVLVSWGDPDKTAKVAKGADKGLEEWLYGPYHLFFRDKQLVKIKLPDPAIPKKTAVKPAPGDDKKNNDKDEPMIEVTGAVKKEGR